MFRRSRFSIRPNVGSAGRAAATPQEAPTASQEVSETPKDISENITATAVTDNKSDVTPSEKPTASGDGNDQNGEGSSTSAAVQRRKRFSIKPKVAPGRLSTLSRTPKSPAKAISETPVETSVSDLDKPTTSSQTGAPTSPRGLQSPRRRRPSEDSKQLKVQPKATIISSDSSGPSAVPAAEDLQDQTHQPADSGKQLDSTSSSPVKEAPSRLPDKVPPSLPDKEAIEISEKAKTLVSCESGLSLSPSAFSLSRLLNDPSDLHRIAKAQKLRDLLRQEMHKEKRKKKNKTRIKEFSLDPAKMTMRDLIRYLPESNPMTSSVEETINENETIVPPSPPSPETAPEPEAVPKVVTPAEEGEAEAQEDQDEEEDDSLMVPQVKVAEDGSLIIDEESLTVEVQRAKGPNLAQERDPIFERGSTTTYSSFRKGTYSKPWSAEETDMFFLAISMVGTDFSMICQLFPHRARSEIKNKFKKEERENSWRIDKAFRERRRLDIEYFSKLLEKILEVQKNRKKLKSLASKNAPKKPKRKTKTKKATKKLSDVEEENEEEENDMPDLEGEGEKENEALCNEGESPVSKPKKTQKRKKDASEEGPKDKKNKRAEKGNEQDEANIPEETEAALPVDCTNSDISEKTAQDTTIKPAKLSRGRAPKPLLPLGRKWAKKLPKPSKAGDTVSDNEDKCVTDGATQEQVNKDASPLKQANKKTSDDDGSSSEEEESIVPPTRRTRYGRMSKPTKPLNYSAKEDKHSSASESTPSSPAPASAARPKPKSTAKRGRPSKAQSAQESKKPKLVTLRASQSDYSDEESEKQWEEEEEEQQPACGSGNDSSAAAFVPTSLQSPRPLSSEVEESMEELDILANMPDVLGISQDALCPDASCERAHNETCEHQLDLLVDVIDFLSSEHTEVSEDQSYNEAAETLLTIGNVAHLPQAAQSPKAPEEPTTEPSSVSVDETSEHLEEKTASKPAAQEEHSATLLISAASGSGGTKTTLELQTSTTDSENMPSVNQQTDLEIVPTPKSHTEDTKTDSPQSKMGRLSKVKPKPNLSRVSRAAQLKSRPEKSSAQKTQETQSDANTSPADDVGVAAETTASSEDLLKDDKVPSTCLEVKRTDEQKKSVAVTSDSETREVKDNRDSSSTDVIPDPHVGTTKSSTNNLVSSDAEVTGSQIEQEMHTDPDSVQVSSEPPAAGDTPGEESADSQKEESEGASASQTRKSRFQRVKPKPNLAQTSRSVRSRPQTVTDGGKKQTQTPSVDDKTTTVSAEPSTSPKKPSQSDDSTSSQDLGSTFTQSGKLLMMEQKSTAEFVGVQEEVGAVPLDQDASENQNTSEPRREQASLEKKPTPESMEGKRMSDVVTVSQVEQKSNTSVAPVLPAVVLPVTHKQEGEDASPSQPRKCRFQRAKPNLTQTSRAVRSKPQTTKDVVEEDSTPNLNPSIHEKSAVEVSEPSCVISTENLSQSIELTSGSRSSLTPAEEVPQTELKNKESGGTTLDESSSKNQIFSEAPLETSKESTTEEHIMSHVKKAESKRTNSQVEQVSEIDSALIQETSDQLPLCPSHEEESPVSQKQDSEDSATQQTRRSRFQRVRPKPNLPQTSRSVRSKPQTTSDIDTNQAPNPSETVIDISGDPDEKPPLGLGSTRTSKDNLPGIEGKNTGDQGLCGTIPHEKSSTVPSQGFSSTQNPSEEFSSAEEPNMTSSGQDSSSEGSVPQRRQRFPKVKPKPNIGSSTRSRQTKKTLSNDVSASLQQSDNDTVENRSAQREESTDVMNTQCRLQTEGEPVESGKLVDSAQDKDASAPDSVPENKSTEKERVVVAGKSKGDIKEEDQPTLLPDSSFGASETKTEELAAVLDVGSSAGCPTESDMNSNNQSKPDSKGHAQLPQSECDTEVQCQDAAPQSSDTDHSASQSSHHNQSEPTNSFKSPVKARQSRRGWSVKPKPNLGRNHRPLQTQQAQTTKEAQADSGTASEAGSALASQEQVCELQPYTPDPLEEALEHCITQSSFTVVTESSFGSVAQEPDNSTQDAPTSSSGGTHSQTLSLFPDMLSSQIPSDPDETFFTLCLIPVCSSGEVLDSTSELLSYVPVAELQQQSDTGVHMTAVGGEPLFNVPVSGEESAERDLISVKDIGPDPAAHSVVENPVEPDGSSAVQPPEIPGTVEGNDETEIPPTKKRPQGTTRRAKQLVKPKTSRKRQASETVAAKEEESILSETTTNATEESELPGLSVQPRGVEEVVSEQSRRGGSRRNAAKKALASLKEPEESSSGAQRRQTRGTLSRKPAETGNPAPPSDSPPAKAESESQNVKTPQAGRKRARLEPAASTPNVSRTFSTKTTQTETHTEQTSGSRTRSEQPFSASQSSVEDLHSQQSLDSSSIEEATSVSQYFLSDIFTDVEEL